MCILSYIRNELNSELCHVPEVFLVTGSCLWLAFQMSRECFRAIGQWDLLARSECPIRHSPLYILAGFRDSYLYPTANVHLESKHYRKKKELDLFSGNVQNPKSDGKGRVGLRKRKTFRLTSCHLIRKKGETGMDFK